MRGLVLLINILTTIVGLVFGFLPFIAGLLGGLIVSTFNGDTFGMDLFMVFGVALMIIGILNLVLGITSYVAMKESLKSYMISQIILTWSAAGVFGYWLYGWFKSDSIDFEHIFEGSSLFIHGIPIVMVCLNVFAFLLAFFYALLHINDKKKARVV